MQANHNKLTLSDPSILESIQPGSRKKALWAGLAVIVVVAIAAMIWVVVGLQGREQEFEADLQKRLELMAASQVQYIDNMLETVIEQSSRVINAELFRLYAAEVHLVQDDVALLVSGSLPGQEGASEDVAQLSAQLPMMQSLLTEFTRISGYLAGRVVNRNGTVFIATDASTTPLREGQMTIVQQTVASQQPEFGPLRPSEQGLLLEAYLPIFPPESSGLEQQPVAVLLLTKIVDEKLKALSSNRLLEKGERTRLLQKVATGYQEVVPWRPDPLQNVGNFPAEQKEALPFATRKALDADTPAYSVGRQVNRADWWLVVEADYQIAREGLRTQQRSMMSIALLLVLVFSVTFGAFWALLLSSQERRSARHFKRLAEEIENQRQLLDRINNTISDYLVLKDLDGRYRYVNPAFAEAVGRAPHELIGFDNEAVFGYDTARRLEHSDQQVLATGETVTFEELLYLQSQPHHLQISKSALKDAEGKITGIVSVFRDVTEIVAVQKRQEQATAKTVEALVKAIELIDPYLSGQSRLMGQLGAEVAKAMNASDVDIATIQTAANLSQIGKIFIDRELLFKTDPLTEEEKQQMEKHVAYAGKILEDIDFGLPVYEAVYQMNEAMDGSGYPSGLEGSEMTLPARVLAVVNSFCAMVEPRAYRGARPVENVLQILESHPGTYDQRIVALLKEVVHSALGEKLLRGNRA